MFCACLTVRELRLHIPLGLEAYDCSQIAQRDGRTLIRLELNWIAVGDLKLAQPVGVVCPKG